ncbi:MAG: hypothetical protein M1839_000781 [Geoglossum umbratile]|nr:MAG: hypothetical protein M1839_000781 [Geoglossum umbratile]
MSVVLTEDEAIAFREKAKALKPDHGSKPSTFWVGVLRQDKTHETLGEQADLVWMKCHKKITIDTIYKSYISRCQDEGITIIGNFGPVSGSATMAELNDHGDNLIILRAVQSSPTRLPLHPTNKQIALKPEPQETADSMKPQWSPENAIKKAEFLALHPPNGNSSLLSPQNGPLLALKEDPEPKPPVPIGDVPTRGISEPYIGPSGPIKTERRSETPADQKPTLPLERQESQEEDSESESIKTEDTAVSGNAHLRALCAISSPEALEKVVKVGLGFLESLREHFSEQAQRNSDSVQWLQQIETVKMQASRARTIVGVVGNTGAGKSSVINAMLDEERLVPTNCMRACTAVVTELSYNESDDPEKKYSAKIEFIAAADWEKELKILFQELIDADGKISRDCNNHESEAGIAYAKIRAVYPRKTKDDLGKSSVAALMEDPSIKNLFGTTREIHCSGAGAFHAQLQQYVDSKEKSDKGDKKDKRDKKGMGIHVKASALSTGAVIVDLPGVHDQNAARAAVAESYMKQCTGLWIVAPITRAVDDKAAKDLLGESFKRQLKMDGGYSSVTFICSKTDDISVGEAIDSLGLEDELSGFNERITNYRVEEKRLKVKLAEFKESKAVYKQTMDEADEQIEIWETLKDDIEDGKTVYDPSSNSKKRKRGSPKEENSKKRRQESDPGDSDFQDDEVEVESVVEVSGDDENSTDQNIRKPLTAEEVNAKVSELRDRKKAARQQHRELNGCIHTAKNDLEKIDVEMDDVNREMSALCIAGRNAYSKGAIQRDFAAGIRELDQELALEEDEENFDPNVELRDYEQVANSLPVFCVSSRGYQKLQGRMMNDQSIPAFTNVEETEIPGLQAHCKKLTEAGRAANCRRFLNSMSQLRNSLSLWASTDGSSACLTNDQKAGELKVLHKKLGKLEDKLDRIVEKCMNELKEELGYHIYDRYEPAVSNATQSASVTCNRWGAPINRENRAEGGYHFQTYKAICRRGGVYSNHYGTHDLNMQLVEPMIKILATGWERAFARAIPTVLSQYARAAGRALESFHNGVEARARVNGVGIAGLAMLVQQLHTYEAIFKDVVAISTDVINARQREINREFTPVIAVAMQTVYGLCENESGVGSFARMRSHMSNHVDHAKDIMFKKSTDEVRRHLGKMLSSVQETVANRTEKVFLLIKRDYMSVLGGGSSTQELMPKEERLARRGAEDIVRKYDRDWQELANVEGENAIGNDVRGIDMDDRNPVKEEARSSPQVDNGDVEMELDEDGGPSNVSEE